MDANLSLKIDSKQAETATKSLHDLGIASGKAERSAKSLEGGTAKLNQNLESMGKGLDTVKKLAAVAFTGWGLSEISGKVLEVTREFQSLQASLETVVGTANAPDAFRSIQQFAKETPYQLTQVTDAFIQMNALGLKASNETLRAYGDTASSMNKTLDQIIQAVADAATGEFERLKEFGIKAQNQGDTIRFIFRGVSTDVANNSSDIQNYLINLGKTNFAGGMARQMDTLNGEISNLQDNWDKAFNAIGEKTNGITTTVITALNKTADTVFRVFTSTQKLQELAAQTQQELFGKTRQQEVNDYKTQIEATNSQIKTLQSQVEQLAPFMGKSTYAADQVKAYQAQIESLRATVSKLTDEIYGLDPNDEIGKVEAQIAKVYADAETYTRKQIKLHKELVQQLSQLGATEEEQRKKILAGMTSENAALQKKIWVLQDSKKATATGDWNTMLSGQTDEFDQATKKLEDQIDSLTKSTNSFGEAWTRTGDKIVDAMGSAGQVLEKYGNKELQINTLLAKARKDGEVDTQKITALEKARKDASIKGSMAMLDASVSMYKEGSDAQKTAHNAAVAFHATEMAMNIQKAISAAVVGTANQAQGDPYTAFGRMVAMAAMMGGLLSQIGASFGGVGGASAAVAAQPSAGAGVLGGGTSNALPNALKYMDDMQADQYNELKGIHAELVDLNSNFKGALSTLYTTGDLSGLSSNTSTYTKSGVQNAISSLQNLTSGIMSNKIFQALTGTGFLGDPLGNIVGGALNSIASGLGFGGTSKSTSDYGLSVGGTLGSQAIGGYETIRYRKDPGWFQKTKTWTETYQKSISAQGQQAISQILTNMRDTMISLGAQLNRDISSQVNNFALSIGNISMTGSSSDIQQRLQQAFSQQSDKLAYALFPDLINGYRQVSESAFETLSRLVVDKAVTTSLVGMTGQRMVGDAIALSESLIKIAGGLDKLQSAASNFFDKFFTDSEKFTYNQTQLTDALGQMNLSLPATREGFKNLVDSLDLSTEAGQNEYVQLMKLSDQADQYYTQVEKSQNDFISSLTQLKDALDNTYNSINQTTVAGSIQYTQAQVTLANALQQAQLGNIPTLASLQGSLSVLSRNSASRYATYADYQKDQTYTASMLQQLSDYTGSQIDVQQSMLGQLQIIANNTQSLSTSYSTSAASVSYQPLSGSSITTMSVVNDSQMTQANSILSDIRTDIRNLYDLQQQSNLKMLSYAEDTRDSVLRIDTIGVLSRT